MQLHPELITAVVAGHERDLARRAEQRRRRGRLLPSARRTRVHESRTSDAPMTGGSHA
jgi:hypothetical protein